MTPERITLTGFSGTGKSTVARLVAQRLGWDWVDSDDLVEKGAGMPVERIFAEQGEAAFRRRELEVLRDLEKRTRLVVAAGGGATLLDDGRRSIAASGLVACLEATPETIVSRLDSSADASERPLLASGDRLARISRLKAQRAALYALADFTVHTDALSPEDVADEVVRLVREHGEHAFVHPGRIDALTATLPGLPPVIDAPGAATVVRTASAEYPVWVEWGALERLGTFVRRSTGARRVFVMADEAALSAWGNVALGSLKAEGLDVVSVAVTPGDATKTLEGASELYRWLASQRAERRDAVVALGGGMVGDLAGFVAGTYLRGMSLVQAPTTLLAMVDASIGGKTAVNLGAAKNIVGVFNQPRAVVADVRTLTTMPRRSLVEGLGEVIKHAFILAPDLLDLLESRLEDLIALDPEITTDVIRRNVLIKAAVVSEDERETGGRRELLNYGHTLGHAFEAAGEYRTLLHGEAVAAGMVAAAEIGRRVGMTPPEVVERQRRLIERAGLPTRPPTGIDRAAVEQALALDKKIVGGKQRWVLLAEVVRAVVRDDVPTSVVNDVIDQMLGS